MIHVIIMPITISRVYKDDWKIFFLNQQCHDRLNSPKSYVGYAIGNHYETNMAFV